MDIDVQGVRQVKESVLSCRYLFIAPPSMESLKARLVGRGTETDEKIEMRLKNAKDEMAYSQEENAFDSILVNEDVHVAFEALEKKLLMWYPHLVQK